MLFHDYRSKTSKSLASRSSVLLQATLVTLAVTGLTSCGQSAAPAEDPFVKPSRGNSKNVGEVGLPIVATANTTRITTDDPDIAAAAASRAVYSGGAAETQAQVVALIDRRDWRNVLAASPLIADPISAAPLYTDGSSLPQATARGLESLAPTGSKSLGGAKALVVGTAASPAGMTTKAVSGSNPYALTQSVDQLITLTAGKSSRDVLVVSDNRPDFATPAAFLAAKSGVTIVFASADSVPKETIAIIQRRRKARIFVLGPNNVISDKVTKQLAKYGKLQRIGGLSPVENAIGLARFGHGSFGWNINQPGHGFAFARASDALQAMTLAPFAKTGLHGPLLLVDTGSVLPKPLHEYLLSVQPGYTNDPVNGVYNRGWLVGSTAAITPTIQSQIDALLEITPVKSQTQAITPAVSADQFSNSTSKTGKVTKKAAKKAQTDRTVKKSKDTKK